MPLCRGAHGGQEIIQIWVHIEDNTQRSVEMREDHFAVPAAHWTLTTAPHAAQQRGARRTTYQLYAARYKLISPEVGEAF